MQKMNLIERETRYYTLKVETRQCSIMIKVMRWASRKNYSKPYPFSHLREVCDQFMPSKNEHEVSED